MSKPNDSYDNLNTSDAEPKSDSNYDDRHFDDIDPTGERDPSYDDRDFEDIHAAADESPNADPQNLKPEGSLPIGDTKGKTGGIDRDSLKAASSMGSFGLYLLIAVVVGYFLGRFIDNFFNTKPVFIIILIAAGIASSILELVKNIKKASRLGD